MPKLPGWLKLFLKILVSAGCLYVVFTKIDWQQSFSLILSAHPGYLSMAALFFILSKMISSFRLNYYFKAIEINISEKANMQLYWLGMFYNLFLPGGIGGDAYKGILLARRFKHAGNKNIASGLLLDRLSGLVGLAILFLIFWRFAQPGEALSLYGLLLIPLGSWFFYFLVKKWFPVFLKCFHPTYWMGLLVQALQVVCVWFIMRSLSVEGHEFILIMLFLLSSMVAVFPFTIGGLGARELVFLWGAREFGVDQQLSVSISLLFYLITVTVSAVGIIWEYRKIEGIKRINLYLCI